MGRKPNGTPFACYNFQLVTFISPFRISAAVRRLQRGEVLSYPTEAVYGLGCDPLNKNAVMRLLQLKQRPMSKGLIIVAASLQQLESYLLLDDAIRERCMATWPGPVTWVVPVRDWVPIWLAGEHHSLAARVSAHPVVRALCECFGGPIVSTSANPGGKPPAVTALQVRHYFSGNVSIFNSATGSLHGATPIYDALSGCIIR
jgi:L-threonylcarbamoyladenylate synthase